MLDEKILKILRTRLGSYVSGEELRKDSGISRAAIWKHVEKLREEGYDIEATPHLGYRLLALPDSLIPCEIKWELGTKVFGREVISYKKLDSTNDTAYHLAEKGVKEGTVILAEEQAHGKGRLGRKWISPVKGGIYMSCVLRPGITPNEIPRITLLAAVAVSISLRKISGLWALIKWPNDILISGRKVCGILTEMKAEQDKVDFIVLGIGVNVNTPLVHLPKSATSLKEELADLGRDECVSRVELVKSILRNLEKYYSLMQIKGFDPIIDAWKCHSAMIGARVKVNLQDRAFEAQVHDIDADGYLLVRRERGIVEKISSGDVVIVR